MGSAVDFYEGGRSVTILINTVSTDYFVFATDITEPVATRSVAEGTSTDRVEGLTSYEVTLDGSSFWAAGLVWFFADRPLELDDDVRELQVE